MVTVEHVLTAGHWGGAGLRMTFCVCHFPCYCIWLFLSISGALRPVRVSLSKSCVSRIAGDAEASKILRHDR